MRSYIRRGNLDRKRWQFKSVYGKVIFDTW